MNLYRSFGNLMEAWVTEEFQGLDSAWTGNNDEDPHTPPSDVASNLRSESVDSGVETASSAISSPATPSSVLTEIDTFSPEREASTPQSPLRFSPMPSSSSSSSPLLRPSRAQVASTALNLKVEQALQKTASKRLKKNRETTIVDEILRRPAASLVHNQEQSESVRGQRSQSLALQRTVNASAPMRQIAEMRRRPMSMCSAQTRSEDVGEEERMRLSPGLCYLEQVCQMLEEVAKQQMQSRGLPIEADGPREHQDMAVSQILDTRQSDSKAEEDLPSCQRPERSESAEQGEPQQQKGYLHGHFRQRSASDTNISTLQMRKFNADCRGQHQSADDLLEMEEEDLEKQGSEKEETKKSNRNWKMKFGSLTRAEFAVRNKKGQQTQPSEKRSTWRRLSQLIKRRKTLPV